MTRKLVGNFFFCYSLNIVDVRDWKWDGGLIFGGGGWGGRGSYL